MRSHRLFVAAITVIVLVAAPDAASAGTMSVTASYAPEGVEINWTFYEFPTTPVGRPEWTGYDLYRRTVADCGEFVRVNAKPFPRTLGVTHSHTYVETPPLTEVMYEYRVRFVDAERHEVHLNVYECDFCGGRNTWASFPQNSAPLTHGTLRSGWADVMPCANSCYGYFYVANLDEHPDLLQYRGTDVKLRFFGQAYCGTVEGCAMSLDRFEVAPCAGPTPVTRASWGRLKTIYR